ncbi:MAG: glutamine amidotransferase, partial [Planctomycetia bacterium]
SDKATLDTFDVFIIGDLDSSYLSAEQQQRIVERVQGGAGLIMLGGYHSLGPGGYEKTTLGQILPVQLGPRDIGQITESFLPELTPEGVRHPIFANITNYFPTTTGGPKIPGLPNLEGCTRVGEAKPGASTLALCPADEKKPPVLVVGRVDEGRVAVFTGDTTRNWQQGPHVVGQESPYLRFWGQTIRWLAGRDEALVAEAGLTLETDKSIYQPGETVTLTAVVRDKEGKGVSKTSPTATIKQPTDDPKQLSLSPAPGPAGRYRATFEPEQSGKHTIRASVSLDDQTLEAEPVTIEVGRPSLEFEQLALDEKMLRAIAEASDGRYVHLSTADYLIDSLDRSARAETEQLELRLYYPTLFWILFVLLLTTEWFLRLRIARLS